MKTWLIGGGIPVGGLPLCGWPTLGIPGKDIFPLGVSKFITRALSYMLFALGVSGRLVANSVLYRLPAISWETVFRGDSDVYVFVSRSKEYKFTAKSE